MRLVGPIDVRLEFCGGFVDVNQIENYHNYALKFRFWGYFSYYALCRFTEEDNNIQMIVFPHKGWFDEWLENLKIKPEIIFQGGKE